MFTHIARQSVPAPVITSSGKNQYSIRFQWYKYPPVYNYKGSFIYVQIAWIAIICVIIAFNPYSGAYMLSLFLNSLLGNVRSVDTSAFWYFVIAAFIGPYTLVFLFRLFLSIQTWRPREIAIELDSKNLKVVANGKIKETYRTSDISLFQITSSSDMHYAVDTRNQYSPLYDVVLVMHGGHAASINRNSIPLAVNSEIAGTLNDILEKLRLST